MNAIQGSDGEIGPPMVAAPIMHAEPSESGVEAEAKVRAMKRTKLAIVGFAPSSYQQAPFHDASWEIWGLNDLYVLPGVVRADRWFEMHLRQEVDISTRDPNHVNVIRKQRDLPIYMIRRFDDIPMSLPYPLKEVVHHFALKGTGADYLTNTISYEIALACYEKDLGLADWQYIGVWGVDMAQGGAYGQPSEYAEQRPSCEFWLGQAAGRGIYVYIPPASDLLKSPGLYGYEGDGSQMRMKIRLRLEELHGRISGTRTQIGVLERNRMGIAGERALASMMPADKGIDGLKAFIAERMATLAAQDAQFEQQLAALQRQAAQLEGAADDCMYWMRKYTLPTFTQEHLSELDERPHAALSDGLVAPILVPPPNATVTAVVSEPPIADAKTVTAA